MWDAESGKELLTLRATRALLALWPSAPMASVSPPPVGTTRRRCGTRRTGRELLTLKGHSNQVLGVAFSPDGKRIATASDDQTAKVWDAESGQGTADPEGPLELVLAAWPSAPMASASSAPVLDNTVKVWDADSGQELLDPQGTHELV